MTKKYFFLLIELVIACNHIETGQSLSASDIAHIKGLKLLDRDESIIKFYSEYKNKVAGNFFTDKRIAEYWIDERDSTRNHISSAFYPDIISIDTVFYAGLTYSPYMLVRRRDGSQFKVSTDGSKKDIKAFFEDALKTWMQHRLVIRK